MANAAKRPASRDSSEDDIRVRARKRVSAACARCQRQKVRCSGTRPCVRCEKRRIPCHEGDRQRVSLSYVRELQARVAAAGRQDYIAPVATEQSNGLSEIELPQVSIEQPFEESIEAEEDPPTSSPHINDLAVGQSVYVADNRGRAIWLGTSSTWAFGRRVLLIAYERIMLVPLPTNDLLWPGKVYDLEYDGTRRAARETPASPVLPQPDHAMYLINAVKFYVGQIFHLFDEATFMQKFNRFHDPVTREEEKETIWYNHYLLLLAFGQAFVAREGKGKLPPGSDFFMAAMRLMPDYNFADFSDPLEAIEVLCCASLYLHSLELRAAAFRLIGQALRMSLEQGLHTEMNDRHISEASLQRARKIWWTVHLLDRQMSTLQGTPMAVRDEDANAGLPSFEGNTTRVRSLTLHIRLSNLLADIVRNIYGKEGRLEARFLSHTKSALRSIASVTEDLKKEFPLQSEGSVGVSRVASFLHLLLHQCVVLATRPILLNLLQSRLARQDKSPQPLTIDKNIVALLEMCKDSALQMLKILIALQQQSLLESFLPFDLDATYTCCIIFLVGAHIDLPLLDSYQPCAVACYSLLDEMEFRGNRIAQYLRKELQHIEAALTRLPNDAQRLLEAEADGHQTTEKMTVDQNTLSAVDGNGQRRTLPSRSVTSIPEDSTSAFADPFEEWLKEGLVEPTGFDAEQMALIADSIDPGTIDWWFDEPWPPAELTQL